MTNSINSEWIGIIGLAILFMTHLWNVAFKLTALIHKVDHLTETVKAMKVNVDKIPLIEHRVEALELSQSLSRKTISPSP